MGGEEWLSLCNRKDTRRMAMLVEDWDVFYLLLTVGIALTFYLQTFGWSLPWLN